MSNQDKITVELSRQESLVLFEFLHRCDDEKKYSFVDQAEQKVLWILANILESQLVDIFDPNYEALVEAAWAEIRDDE